MAWVSSKSWVPRRHLFPIQLKALWPQLIPSFMFSGGYTTPAVCPPSKTLQSEQEPPHHRPLAKVLPELQ